MSVVDRIASLLPLACIALAFAAPVVAIATDKAETKMGKLGGAPAALFGFVMLFIAWGLAYHLRRQWVVNSLLARVAPVILLLFWLWVWGVVSHFSPS